VGSRRRKCAFARAVKAASARRVGDHIVKSEKVEVKVEVKAEIVEVAKRRKELNVSTRELTCSYPALYTCTFLPTSATSPPPSPRDVVSTSPPPVKRGPAYVAPIDSKPYRTLAQLSLSREGCGVRPCMRTPG
jgi:hypothetical protein